MGVENLPKTVWWDVDETTGHPGVYIVDQTRLPLQGDMLCCNTSEGVCEAISTMALRGAPALGVGAAFAVAIWSANESQETDVDSYLSGMEKVVERVSSVRPTAVNLSWGAHEVLDWARAHASLPLPELKEGVIAYSKSIRDDDEAKCRAIGANGAELFEAFQEDGVRPDGSPNHGARILTHCNAGSLATAFYGTALGVVYSAFEKGRVNLVWVDETRPVNQGARLTAWELSMSGVPNVLICDSAAASLMGQGRVDAVIVGADRICRNGDVANKIGTYGLACLAKMHDVPFYVAAPTSTIDPACACGDDVTIEQRDARELHGFTAAGIVLPDEKVVSRALDRLTEDGTRSIKIKNGSQMEIARKGGGYEFASWMRTVPANVLSYNPAFDITPASFVTKIITERGVFDPQEVMGSLSTDAS